MNTIVENENTDNTSLSSSNSIETKIKQINKQNNHYSRKLKIIAELLNGICQENKSNTEENMILLKSFISKKIPSVSIFDYIERLSKYGRANEEICIFILIYLDKICAMHRINLNYYIIHKLILASFVCSVKFHEDEYYSIGFYAKLGGVSKKDAINLEYEFISLMDFKLFVNQELYNKYCNNLINLEDIDIDDDYDFVVN